MSEGLKQGSYTRTEGRQAGGTYPRFFTESVKDILASEQQGRDIFKPEERVEIIMPGISQLTKPVEKVRQDHIERWPEEYKKFKAGMEMSVDGTPLEQWPVLKREMVLELKFLGFQTIEQIAAMTDMAMQRIPMMGRRLKELAIAYLDDEQAGAMLAAATAKNERDNQIIREQNDKIAKLSAQLESLSARLIADQDRPHPIATYVPGQNDPAEYARQAQPQAAPAHSALDDLPAPRRRGRPSNAEIASRNGDAA